MERPLFLSAHEPPEAQCISYYYHTHHGRKPISRLIYRLVISKRPFMKKSFITHPMMKWDDDIGSAKVLNIKYCTRPIHTQMMSHFRRELKIHFNYHNCRILSKYCYYIDIKDKHIFKDRILYKCTHIEICF